MTICDSSDPSPRMRDVTRFSDSMRRQIAEPVRPVDLRFTACSTAAFEPGRYDPAPIARTEYACAGCAAPRWTGEPCAYCGRGK